MASVCSIQVHLDTMDVAGDNQLNIERNMVKQRLSSSGIEIGQPDSEGEGQPVSNAELFFD